MTNVILNPGFDDAALTPWTKYTNGVLTFTADAVSPYSGAKCAKCAVGNPVGTNSQIYQLNVKLQASTKYRLSFAAYSSDGRDMYVGASKQTTPFTVYISAQVLNLTTSWSYYTFDVTSSASASTDTTFFFLFSTHATIGTIYYIDEVKLEKISEIEPKMFSMF